MEALDLVVLEENRGHKTLFELAVQQFDFIKSITFVSTVEELFRHVRSQPCNAIVFNIELNPYRNDNLNGIDAYARLKVLGKHIPGLALSISTNHEMFPVYRGMTEIVWKGDLYDRDFTKLREKLLMLQKRLGDPIIHAPEIKIPILYNKETKFVEVAVSSVLFIQSAGKENLVHTHQNTYKSDVTLKMYKEILKDENFGMIGNSTLVNFDKAIFTKGEGDQPGTITFCNDPRKINLSPEDAERIAELYNCIE